MHVIDFQISDFPNHATSAALCGLWKDSLYRPIASVRVVANRTMVGISVTYRWKQTNTSTPAAGRPSGVKTCPRTVFSSLLDSLKALGPGLSAFRLSAAGRALVDSSALLFGSAAALCCCARATATVPTSAKRQATAIQQRPAIGLIGKPASTCVNRRLSVPASVTAASA
jgi:hypothetical protein